MSASAIKALLGCEQLPATRKRMLRELVTIARRCETRVELAQRLGIERTTLYRLGVEYPDVAAALERGGL